MSKKTSRRKILTGLSVGATAALAGCSSLFGNGNGNGNGNGSGDQSPSPANFNYPEGFSQEGIDEFATALGRDSAHYTSDSFRFDSEYQFDRPDGSTQELQAESQVSGADEQQYYYSENSSSIQEQYHDGTNVYLRLYSKQQEQAQYQVQETEFNKEGAYLLTLFENQLKGVDFSVDEVVSQSRVRYEATLDDLPDDHFMFQQYNNLVEFQTLLTIDTDGYARRVEVNLSRETSTSGDGSGTDSDSSGEDSTTVIDESYWFEFKDHGEVTVEEPDWLPEAKATQESSSGDDSTSDGSTSDDSTSDGSTSDGDDSTSSIEPVGF